MALKVSKSKTHGSQNLNLYLKYNDKVCSTDELEAQLFYICMALNS